ncbi:MAG: arginine--tRNA ligase [Rickettsiales bacterium]|nr:arginine--tRNA ligase [Rickettsiales bacterium]
MNVFKKIEREIHLIIHALKAEGALPATVNEAKVEATPPREQGHGDIATNAAMILAAQAGKKPREIAEMLLPRLQGLAGVAKVEIAGPGFINITLSASIWQECVADILEAGLGYGNSSVGEGQNINIEFVSANPTGPMHVGHGRGAVYGDALATLLMKAGYNVTREYYINDAGAQVDKVADSAYLRYREATGEAITIPEGYYPGEYLIPIGEGLLATHGKKLLEMPREQWLPVVKEYSLSTIMVMIKEDLAALGIHHNVFTSEHALTLSGKVEAAIAKLEAEGLIYRGILEPPKGKTPDDWEPREQTLFKSTDFGDDCDRPVKKSDGSWTYFAPDIAYHYDKCTRGFTKLIDVFGADHGGYVKRLKAVVKALSKNTVELEVKLCQLVKFLRDGEPAKMSKRAGTFVTVREVVDEVGKDVFRFIMLTRKNDVPLDFDFAKVMEQSKDNPVFYVQYAHARSHSIIRNAAGEMPEAVKASRQPTPAHLARLTHPAELALIQQLCNWPRLVESAALGLEPHRVAFFLHDIAASFHGFWNQGNDDLGLRFIIKSDIELTTARIALARAVAAVIASGLLVLGVEPVEEMR